MGFFLSRSTFIKIFAGRNMKWSPFFLFCFSFPLSARTTKMLLCSDGDGDGGGLVTVRTENLAGTLELPLLVRSVKFSFFSLVSTGG